MKLQLPAHLLAINPKLDGETITLAAGRRSKYGNKRIEADGYTFDSQAEYRRFRELQLDPDVARLAVHTRFALVVDGVKVGVYESDFDYSRRNGRRWRYVVEDVKSPATKTALYELKKRLMWACHRIEIVEIEP